MNKFIPNYKNILFAAQNKKSPRVPIYEHNVAVEKMEEITGSAINECYAEDKVEFFKRYSNFFLKNGYDVVTFEQCIGPIMPGSGALGRHVDGVIKTMDDYNKYPWDEIESYYFDAFTQNFDALEMAMPHGMKAIGGVGNGVFECVQDIVGYIDLCYIKSDDPELYELLFKKMGKVIYKIWSRFLERYADLYTVCRIGDDLGFKSTTLLSASDIKNLIVPVYKNVISLIHSYNKPFLLHSCGQIFDIMPELIDVAKIDAKHSNEDVIAPFSKWVDDYGNKIGNFGGFDTDIVCQLDEMALKEYVTEIFHYCKDKNGIALGSGNSIPNYVPAANYLCIINTVRELRGDFK